MQTLVPEKYRVCETNKQGILKTTMNVCLRHTEHVIESHFSQGILYVVRLRYPSDITVTCHNLQEPMGILNHKGIVFIACSATVMCINIANHLTIDQGSITVMHLKDALKSVNSYNPTQYGTRKAPLQQTLMKILCNLS